MTVDPFRLAIALLPLAAYVLLLGLLNLRRRPFLTSGGCDVAALGVALSGLMFVGPLEEKRFVDVSENAFYWYFVVLTWLPIYGLIYFAPRVA